MNEPIRVLQVFSSLDRGGAEQVVMNWYRKLDRSQIQFDFVVEDVGREYAHEPEIRKLGGKIYRVPHPLPNLPKYVRLWTNLLSAHPEWQIVHAHHTSPAAIYLAIARAKNRKTIAHSHTAGGRNSVKDTAKAIARWPLKGVASKLIACSSAAATWMFGNAPVVVVPNGIDSEAFRFSNERTKSLRSQLGLANNLVIGHVGNFGRAKNHDRIIQVFSKILDRSPSAKLVLVGDGGLRNEIEEYSHRMGIGSHVEFLGVREDIADILGVFDVMLFPSLYEGLPVSLVEAQAAGLPIVMSDTISQEAVLTDLVRSLPLSASDTEWAEATLMASGQLGEREAYCDIVSRTDFQIDRSVAQIEGIYRSGR